MRHFRMIAIDKNGYILYIIEQKTVSPEDQFLTRYWNPTEGVTTIEVHEIDGGESKSFNTYKV